MLHYFFAGVHSLSLPMSAGLRSCPAGLAAPWAHFCSQACPTCLRLASQPGPTNNLPNQGPPPAAHSGCLILETRPTAQPATQARASPARPVCWLHDSLLVLRIALPRDDINLSNDARTCPCLNRHLTSSAACSRTTDAARSAGPRRATRSGYNNFTDSRACLLTALLKISALNVVFGKHCS